MKTFLILDSDMDTIRMIEQFFQKTGLYASLGFTSSTLKAQELIAKHQPELVFINLDGTFEDPFHFSLELQNSPNQKPNLVALSLNTNLAYKALKQGFLDYLVLPFDFQDMHHCFMQSLNRPITEAPFLCLKSYKDFHFLNANQVLFLKADNNTTDFHLLNGDIITAFKTLKTYETTMPNHFKRIHKSYIINTLFLNRMDFGKSLCKLNHFHNLIPFSKKYHDTMGFILASIPKWII